MKPGDIYLAGRTELDFDEEGPLLRRDMWKVEILGKVRNGNVSIRWLEGPLAGREARLVAKTLREVG